MILQEDLALRQCGEGVGVEMMQCMVWVTNRLVVRDIDRQPCPPAQRRQQR